MLNTVIQVCHACGEDIHYFEPWAEKAIVEEISPDQFMGVVAKKVLVGYNYYHKLCEP